MSSITLVTAFFDIGRESFPGYERSAEQYMDYFRFWSRMRNRLVVYTSGDKADAVREIRDGYGLADATSIVVVDDISTFDPEVFLRIGEVMKSPSFKEMRGGFDNPECNFPLYNYITYLKPFFVTDAIRRGLVSGKTAAWIDFGFNHGGRFYSDSLDFDFLWEYDFADKMHLFSMDDFDDMDVVDIVRSMKVYITGALMIGTPGRWFQCEKAFADAARHLLDLGLADDDQTMEIMAYRANPDMFQIRRVDYFPQPLSLVGGEHMKIASVRSRRYRRLKQEARAAWTDGSYGRAMMAYLGYICNKLTGKRECVPLTEIAK